MGSEQPLHLMRGFSETDSQQEAHATSASSCNENSSSLFASRPADSLWSGLGVTSPEPLQDGSPVPPCPRGQRPDLVTSGWNAPRRIAEAPQRRCEGVPAVFEEAPIALGDVSPEKPALGMVQAGFGTP